MAAKVNSGSPASNSPLPPSAFPEYERAASDLLWLSLNEIMARADPLLGMVRRQPTADLPSTASAEAPGDTGSYRPFTVGCEFVQPFDAVLNVDLDHWADMVDRAACQSVGVLMPQVFAHMAEICDKAGQTVDAGGKPLTYDLILDTIEKMEITFDGAGAPEMPTFFLHPKAAEQLRKLPPATPEQLARHDRIIQAKKREFDARRRVRKLDRDP